MYMYICIYVYVYMYMYVCIYIYIYTYIRDLGYLLRPGRRPPDGVGTDGAFTEAATITITITMTITITRTNIRGATFQIVFNLLNFNVLSSTDALFIIADVIYL